jgi:hypothetical protein
MPGVCFPVVQRDFVRFIGCGSTLLCLHTSRARPYGVDMPPQRVALHGSVEASWLQGEVKDLAEASAQHSSHCHLHRLHDMIHP